MIMIIIMIIVNIVKDIALIPSKTLKPTLILKTNANEIIDDNTNKPMKFFQIFVLFNSLSLTIFHL
ncbi:hypothetical protein LCGC14_1092590 [marine sediment metagenome]|uniref:Uncharacterized protein n=1 Tax=marine sediment metagenome TaxID=412755 RepID=A0A0F9MG99_9ZZZZ